MVFGNVSQNRAEDNAVVVNGGTAPLAVTLKIVDNDEAGATKVTSNNDGSIRRGRLL